jgi:hypothetical protein
MSILGRTPHSVLTDYNFGTDATFNVYGYAIGGKMVVGRAEMTEQFKMMMENGDLTAISHIKEKLTRDLVHHILENKLVEFTHHDDPITSRKQLTIRAYLAPNDQVKILRLSKQL